jgi:two-component system sensor histidine kinase/response regulator
MSVIDDASDRPDGRAPGDDMTRASRISGAFRVLTVDDDDSTQDVLRYMLEHLGYEVTSACNGHQAVDAILRAPPFDVILMDVQMPVMDGYEAARWIRRVEAELGFGRVPIVATTAQATADEHERIRGSGMDQLLTKPIELDTLGRELARWTGVSRSGVIVSSPRQVEISETLDMAQIESIKALAGPDRLQFFTGLVAKFRNDASRLVGGICRSVADRDVSTAASLAHALKGSSRSIGARRLGEVAGHVEYFAGRGDIEAASAAAARLEPELRDALAALITIVD